MSGQCILDNFDSSATEHYHKWSVVLLSTLEISAFFYCDYWSRYSTRSDRRLLKLHINTS